MHVVAPRDCEKSAYGELSKANRGRDERHSEGTRGDDMHGRVPERLRREQNGRKQIRKKKNGNNVNMENRQLGWKRTHTLRVHVAVAT